MLSSSQSVKQSVRQFCFSTKILPVSVWCNAIVKFYLEMSASPSGCVLAVIVLSISTALACLLPLPLVKPWQRARGEERWGRVRNKKEYLHHSVCLSLLTFVCLDGVYSWRLTSACFGSAAFTSFSIFFRWIAPCSPGISSLPMYSVFSHNVWISNMLSDLQRQLNVLRNFFVMQKAQHKWFLISILLCSIMKTICKNTSLRLRHPFYTYKRVCMCV